MADESDSDQDQGEIAGMDQQTAEERFLATRLAQHGIDTETRENKPQRAFPNHPSHRDQKKSIKEPTQEDPNTNLPVPNVNLIGSVNSFQAPRQESTLGFPLRTQLATTTNQASVLTNHFTVDIPAGKVLHEYHVLNMPPKATRAKKRTLILDMIVHDKHLFALRDNIATDCQKKIISDRPLYKGSQAVGVYNYMPGSRAHPQSHELELTFVACHELDSLKSSVQGRDVNYTDRGTADALNIVLSKAVTDGNLNNFQVGSIRFYYRKGWKDLKEWGPVGTRGYFSSIKPAMGNILLNVNTVTSPFYKGRDLSEYVQNAGKDKYGNFRADQLKKDRVSQRSSQQAAGLRQFYEETRAQ